MLDGAWEGVPRNRAHDGRCLDLQVAHADARGSGWRAAHDRRRGARPHLATARLDIGFGRQGVQLVERDERHRERRVARVPAEQVSEHARKRRRRGHLNRLVESRHRERLPQQLNQARGLAVPHQPLPHGFIRPRPRYGTPNTQHGNAVAPPERVPSQHPCGQVQRRRQRRTGQPRGAPIAVDDANRKVRLQAKRGLGTNAAQESKCLVIAAEEDMLAVVDAFAGGRVGKRGCAPAQPRPCFEHEDARTLLGERAGGSKAGESPANDNRVRTHGAWN